MAASTPRSWNEPPSVMVVSGNHHFMREREVRKAQWAAGLNKRVVEFVDGKDGAEISTRISGSVLFSQESMVIVTNPQKCDLAMLEAHHDDGDGDLCLVLHHEGKIRGNTKFGKMVKKFASWQHREFNEGKRHETKARAIQFCQDEAKRLKVSITEKLAVILVKVLGMDYGVLHFELRKLAAYAQSLGDTAIEPKHIKGTVSTIGDADALAVMDVLGTADGPRTVKAMARVRQASNRDPTMMLIALISNNGAKWLQAASLDKMGIDPKNAAQQVGLHPFVYERFVLPVGKRWGPAALVQLIKEMSRVERAVKRGAISPWTLLEAGVLASCEAAGRRG
jgi:DNA polymerase III delta subunit